MENFIFSSLTINSKLILIFDKAKRQNEVFSFHFDILYFFTQFHQFRLGFSLKSRLSDLFSIKCQFRFYFRSDVNSDLIFTQI